MRHALILLVFVLTGYAIYQIADRKELKQATRLITRHALRIALIVFALALLLAAAAYFPASNLI